MTLQIIKMIIVYMGIPAIFGVLIYIGRKLQALDTIEREIENTIKPDLKDVRERFFALEGKASNLFQTASPVNLTPKGEDVLVKSGLKNFLDEYKDTLIKSCIDDKKIKNSYDIQTSVFEFFDTYQFPTKLEEELKSAAYRLGVSMEILRRIGAIYFRKFCLEKHGFKEEDLGKPDGEGNQG